MLETITIQCPVCAKATVISVSSERNGGFASSRCRECAQPFIAVNGKDGAILLIDGQREALEKEPQLLAVLEPRGGRSGYRIEPPQRLGIFDRGYPPSPPEPGLSDQELASALVVQGSKALRKQDGSPRDPRAAAQVIGWRGVWVAQLEEALRIRLADPPPLSYPPGVFISYRWSTPAENQWVADLAHELKRRGYPVLFDRDEPQENVDVPQLVSRVADCRYFIAVIDPGYGERLGTRLGRGVRDGWVFDEVNTAIAFENSGHLRVLGFLRTGDAVPMNFRLATEGETGNSLDVRSAAQLALVLDDFFPRIDNAPSEQTSERARALLHESHEHLCARRFSEAFRAAQELAQLLPGVIDGPAQMVRVAYRGGAPQAGLVSAQQALALAPRNGELLLAAGSFASAAGKPRAAVEYLGVFLESCGGKAASQELAAAHHSIGSSLDDLEQIEAALAHLQIARTLRAGNHDLLVTLGYVYLRAGDPEAAIATLREALTLDATHRTGLLNLAIGFLVTARFDDAREVATRFESIAPDHPQLASLRSYLAQRSAPAIAVPRQSGPQVQCSDCAARITLVQPKDMICGRCGAVVPDGERACPCCGSDGRVPLIPGVPSGCPYCRKGQLARR